MTRKIAKLIAKYCSSTLLQTKYDTWEDSDFNDLDDASLKKLLEEAYWYRNPGDRKNKSERFLVSFGSCMCNIYMCV